MALMLEVTGERLLPDQQRGELVHAEHLARYRFASQLARGLRVLDAACGEGYGTAMMAEAGASLVVGVDRDSEVIEHARSRYGLEFKQGDVCELPFEDGSFDLVVSFETIEHVKDGERVISEFRRVLAGDGLLVISTPHKGEYLISTEFHEREYSTEEFRRLLASTFSEVRLLYQQNWLLSAILSEEQSRVDDPGVSLDLDLSKVHGHEPGRELYAIAVCSNAPTRRLHEVGVVTGVYEAHKLSERLEETERLHLIWVERATEAERLVEAWNERATEVERQLEQKMEKLERMESSFSWRLTAPLRSLMAALRRRRG
jgi:SAM-dependent methyltransferase